MKTIRTRVMLRTWELVKQSGFTFSKALKAAWKEVKLTDFKKLLSHSVVKVTFLKINGEVTTRSATRNAAFVPTQFAPKGEGNKNDAVVTFFSLSDEAWRSFRAENLVHYQVA